MHQESSTSSNGGLKRPVPGEEHWLGQYSTIFLLMHSSITRNTVTRLTNCINFLSLGGVATSTKHPNIPWAYQNCFSSLLILTYYIHMLMIHSIKQTNLSQILSKNGFKSSFITSTVFVKKKKKEHVLGLLLFVLTVAFWDYRIAI